MSLLLLLVHLIKWIRCNIVLMNTFRVVKTLCCDKLFNPMKRKFDEKVLRHNADSIFRVKNFYLWTCAPRQCTGSRCTLSFSHAPSFAWICMNLFLIILDRALTPWFVIDITEKFAQMCIAHKQDVFGLDACSFFWEHISQSESSNENDSLDQKTWETCNISCDSTPCHLTLEKVLGFVLKSWEWLWR